MIWVGSEERLHEFHMFINSLDEHLKFTVEIGGLRIAFLDLLIRILNGKLVTTVYSRPADSHLYLQADSCHLEASVMASKRGWHFA